MKETKFSVKTELNVIDYVSMVNAIVSEYFDEDGTYTPHIGKMNAMRLFYNNCVTDSKYDIEHNVSDALELDVFVNDVDFIEAFNRAVEGDGLIRLDFSNAYADAIKIVNTKKSAFNNVISIIKNAISDIVDKINPMLDKESIDKISKIAENISDGSLGVDNIIQAFIDKSENE